MPQSRTPCASNDMLPADQIPSAETMSAANRRLKEWAASRRQRVTVSLAGFIPNAMANEALTIHGHTLPEGKPRDLLQSDKLHLSALGSAVLALAILGAFQSGRPAQSAARSEERRVGKECRCLWAPHHQPKKPANPATPLPS